MSVRLGAKVVCRLWNLKAMLENDSVAVVSYALRFGNGSRETCIKRLKKVDDEWKMCVSE